MLYTWSVVILLRNPEILEHVPWIHLDLSSLFKKDFEHKGALSYPHDSMEVSP